MNMNIIISTPFPLHLHPYMCFELGKVPQNNGEVGFADEVLELATFGIT